MVRRVLHVEEGSGLGCNEPGCIRAANFDSKSGDWCFEHLPLEDIPPDQLKELMEEVAILSPMFQTGVDEGGEMIVTLDTEKEN